jgi:glycosyltransferase involved in cell wall biosynthesis
VSHWGGVEIASALVSIGLPVFNGESHLQLALDALAAQDYPNLEIHISDNASTDSTPTIARALANADPRFIYHRNDQNLGAFENFEKAFRLARGEYFMWAADDDWWAPTYVTKLVAALEANPGAAMACSQVRFIDDDGAQLDLDYTIYENPDLSAKSVIERVRLLMARGGWYQIYGLFRRAALDRTSFRVHYGSDVLLLMDLALTAPFVRVNEVLHHYRQLRGRTEQDRVASLDVEVPSIGQLWTPFTVLQEGLSSVAAASRLRRLTKARVRIEILASAYFRDTVFRRKAEPELPRRLIAAVGQRRLQRAVKYALLLAAAGVRSFAGRVRRKLRS